MHESTIYCIDTSALVDLKLWYRMSTFPSLWHNLGELVKDERLISAYQVLEELKEKDDELLRWARKNKRMFKAEDENQIQVVQEIVILILLLHRVILSAAKNLSRETFRFAQGDTMNWN